MFSAIVILASFSIASVNAATESYLMMCKGGTGSSLKIISNRDGTNATFFFARSRNKGLDNIAPGTCAWMDRPVSSGEPTEIFMQFPGVLTSVQARYERPGQHAVQYELLGGGRRSDRENLRLLINAYRGAGTFYVHAYSDRANGVLRITKFGR
jgi:hypothetical protein